MCPVINVIIVTYNAAATLQQCLNSIYNQQYAAIDIIVIDGKSTDETVQIIQYNADKIKYWLSEPDSGVYDAMNKAAAHINGEWIYFLGADDELLPEFSTMVSELADKTAIYYANVFAEGKKNSGFLNKYRIAKIGIYHQAMIYPKTVFLKYKYDIRYKISADFALTLKLCGDKNYHFVYMDYTIANFNHTGISGTQIDEPFQKEKPAMVYKYFGLKIWLRYLFYKLKNRHNPRA